MKSTSKKQKEGGTRPWRLKCSVLKLESHSKRVLLRDVVLGKLCEPGVESSQQKPLIIEANVLKLLFLSRFC